MFLRELIFYIADLYLLYLFHFYKECYPTVAHTLLDQSLQFTPESGLCLPQKQELYYIESHKIIIFIGQMSDISNFMCFIITEKYYVFGQVDAKINLNSNSNVKL